MGGGEVEGGEEEEEGEGEVGRCDGGGMMEEWGAVGGMIVVK